MLNRQNDKTIVDQIEQLNIRSKKFSDELTHLIKISEDIDNEKSLLEKEQNNLQEQKLLLQKEHILLIDQAKAFEKTQQEIDKLGFEERLNLIDPEFGNDTEYVNQRLLYTCPLNMELMENPVMLNGNDKHVIDESSKCYLKKAKDEQTQEEYYVHPFIPGYEIYENDKAKKGSIIKEVPGKIENFTPFPQRMDGLPEFVERAEKKYYTNEDARIKERQEQIKNEIIKIEQREIHIKQQLEQLNQRTFSIKKEIAGQRTAINELQEKIETLQQIDFITQQANDLEESITALARIMKEEDNIEQGKIDEILIPQILELENLREIIQGLKNEKRDEHGKEMLTKLEASPTISQLKNNYLISNTFSLLGSGYGLFLPMAKAINKASKPENKLTETNTPPFLLNTYSLFSLARRAADSTVDKPATVPAPGLRNQPKTDDVD